MRVLVVVLWSLIFVGSCSKEQPQTEEFEVEAEEHAVEKENTKTKDPIRTTRPPKTEPKTDKPETLPPPKIAPPEVLVPPQTMPPEGGPPAVTTTLIPDFPLPPALALPFWGPRYRQVVLTLRPKNPLKDSDQDLEWLFHWNQIAIDASGLDHTPVEPGDSRVYGEQLGPGRSSRAMAIVHIAILEAIIAAEGGFNSYTKLKPFKGDFSIRAAIAQAAHDTLINLFPSQKQSFDEELAQELLLVKDDDFRSNGIKVGKNAAQSILKIRRNDGSQIPEPLIGTGEGEYDPPVGPGLWGQDPISQVPKAIGAFWSQVKPFIMTSAKQFRAPPPPDLNNPAYTQAFNEDMAVGGDGITTPTERTAEQTEIGIFWAYDGTPSLCAPPRLYNQIAVHIAKQEKTEFIEAARLLALVNIAMAEAGIAGWESKYFYNFWRPVTAIRHADTDGNPDTDPDPTFSPLGAPASNLTGPNFTPPFPAYPSGHATFGAALFQTLRKFYKRDNIAFTFTSDELNGQTKDNQGNVRPLKPRSFNSFSEAEEENGQSRMYLGIHWAFDKVAGMAQGRKVADLVFEKIYQPTN